MGLLDLITKKAGLERLEKLLYSGGKKINPVGIAVKTVGACLSAAGKVNAIFREAPALTKGEFDYTAAPKGELFSVGFGKKAVMPPDITKKKYYIAGYRMNNPATGILDELHAHAVWIDDKSGKGGIIFVSVDSVGILNHDVRIIRKYLEPFCKKTGCRNIQIMTIHDHAGIDTLGYWGALPKTGRSKDFMEIVLNGIITACEEAYADRRDGTIYLGTVEVPDMQSDFRSPYVFSKTLTRFRFVPSDGSREIHMINFAAHPESLKYHNSKISADYVAYFRNEVREKTGAETIYFVGALGGMVTMRSNGKSEEELIEGTKELGRRLAAYALSIENEKRLEPKISILNQDIYFDVSNTVLMALALLDVFQADIFYSKKSPTGFALKTELNYFEIGDVNMLMVPGEIFPELVFGGYLGADECSSGLPPEINPTPLSEIAENPELLIFGLANDELAYIIPPNDYLISTEAPFVERAKDRLGRNHYEETNSLGPKTAPEIAKVFAEMMERVNSAKKKVNRL